MPAGPPGPPSQSLAWYLLSTSHPWRPRQRPTWLKRSNLACGGCDSSRLGLGVRTWPAEAATAADLKGGSGGAKPPQEKKFKLVFGCLNLGELFFVHFIHAALAAG